MARRTLNNTIGLVSPSSKSCTSEYHSKSVREIDNGFVVNESCEKNGEYSSKEYFTKNPAGRGPTAGGETLADAIKECDK